MHYFDFWSSEKTAKIKITFDPVKKYNKNYNNFPSSVEQHIRFSDHSFDLVKNDNFDLPSEHTPVYLLLK